VPLSSTLFCIKTSRIEVKLYVGDRGLPNSAQTQDKTGHDLATID
jgi:hypothetical protein